MTSSSSARLPVFGSNTEEEGDNSSDYDDGNEPTRQTQAACVSEQLYIESGNDKKVLYLLSIGLLEEGENHEQQAPLFSFDQQPWSKLPRSSAICPRNNEYVSEIVRRAELFCIVPPPRPRNWTRPQIMEWLAGNPISNEADVAFLRNEVHRVRGVWERKLQQRLVPMQDESSLVVAASGGRSRSGGSYWRPNLPFLRVIMCLTQDNVKSLFLTRANALSRQQLDGRNSDTR